MSGTAKIGAGLLAVVILAGVVSYFAVGPLGAVVVLVLALVAMFFVFRKLGAGLLASGSGVNPLKGAAIRTHQITEISGPIRRITLADEGRSPQRAEEEAAARADRRFFIIEITATPAQIKPGEQPWKPAEVKLVPAKGGVGEGVVDSFDLWEGTRFLYDRELVEVNGEQRVRFVFSVPRHLEKARLSYHGEAFGEIPLPPHTSSPLAAPPQSAPAAAINAHGFTTSGEAIEIQPREELPVNRAAVRAAGKLTSRLMEEGEVIPTGEGAPTYKISAVKVEGEDHLPDPPGQLRPEDLVVPIKAGASNVKKLSQALSLNQLEASPQAGQANIAAALAQKVADQKKDTHHLRWVSAVTRHMEEEESAADAATLAGAQPRDDLKPPPNQASAPQKPRMTTRTIIPPAPKMASSVVAAAARVATSEPRPNAASAPPVGSPKPAPMEVPAPLVEVEAESAPTPVPAPAAPVPPPQFGSAPKAGAEPAPGSPVGSVALPELPGGEMASVPAGLGARPKAAPKPGVISAGPIAAREKTVEAGDGEETAAPPEPRPSAGLGAGAGSYGIPEFLREDDALQNKPLPMPNFAAPAPADAESAPLPAPEAEPVTAPEPEPKPKPVAAPALEQMPLELPMPVRPEVEAEMPALPESAVFQEKEITRDAPKFDGPDIDLDELERAASEDIAINNYVLPENAKLSPEEMRHPAYYLVINGPPEGPYSLESLFSKLADGSLQLTDHTWKEGMKEWLTMEQVLAEIA